MERRRRVLLIALAVLILGGLVLMLPRHGATSEPVYQGKPLSQWLANYDPTNTVRPTSQMAATQAAIWEMDTNAIPTLLQMLRTTDSRTKVWFINLARKQRLVKVDFVPEMNRYERAAMGLEVLGSRAQSAIPELIEIYNRNPSTNAQQAIARVLGLMGPPAKDAVPSLLRGAASSNGFVRVNAIYALGKIHAQPDAVVPVLAKALQDPDTSTQINALAGLGQFGAEARPAVPALLKYIQRFPPVPANSPYSGISVRGVAVEALKKIDPGAVPVDPGQTNL